jgi:hypothetical protein
MRSFAWNAHKNIVWVFAEFESLAILETIFPAIGRGDSYHFVPPVTE